MRRQREGDGERGRRDCDSRSVGVEYVEVGGEGRRADRSVGDVWVRVAAQRALLDCCGPGGEDGEEEEGRRKRFLSQTSDILGALFVRAQSRWLDGVGSEI